MTKKSKLGNINSIDVEGMKQLGRKRREHEQKGVTVETGQRADRGEAKKRE